MIFECGHFLLWGLPLSVEDSPDPDGEVLLGVGEGAWRGPLRAWGDVAEEAWGGTGSALSWGVPTSVLLPCSGAASMQGFCPCSLIPGRGGSIARLTPWPSPSGASVSPFAHALIRGPSI